jgi:hypothetical protein
MNAPGWYPDPVGRHDFRLWSGSGWTDQVSDDGSQGADPIEPLKPEPVTIRPSTSVFWKLFRSVPVWRWGLSLVLLAIVILMMYLAGGWLLVMALGTLGILCVVLLPVLYFKLFCIRADSAGIEVRNQIGHRHRIPRERIAAVTIGKAWQEVSHRLTLRSSFPRRVNGLGVSTYRIGTQRISVELPVLLDSIFTVGLVAPSTNFIPRRQSSTSHVSTAGRWSRERLLVARFRSCSFWRLL